MEILELQNWEGEYLRYQYTSASKKWLEEKAAALHTLIDALNAAEWQYYIATKIRKGEAKKELILDIIISSSEKYKHKENSHFQEKGI